MAGKKRARQLFMRAKRYARLALKKAIIPELYETNLKIIVFKNARH
jgi:hypothetical protein